MERILIIDDDDMVRDVLREAFLHESYEVVETRNGLEGIGRFQAAPTDLVITDIHMPEKDGPETIRDLRRLHPVVKILAISGGGRTDQLHVLDVARRLGAQHTLRKPFGMHEMLEVVQKMLALDALSSPAVFSRTLVMLAA